MSGIWEVLAKAEVLFFAIGAVVVLIAGIVNITLKYRERKQNAAEPEEEKDILETAITEQTGGGIVTECSASKRCAAVTGIMEAEREREQLAEEVLAAPTVEEQRQAFIANHALTPREVDVLIAVTQDERPLKQVAEELGISMRMVQRHLSSIYQKTDTQARAGLTKAFPSA